jgi:hypothetical protein
MSMKKNSTTTVPTSAIFERRIVWRTITKKTTSGSMITENKGMEGPTVRETDKKMRKILVELLWSCREGTRIWRWKGRTITSS